MKEEINVNVILCKEYDNDTKSITNIFNTIKVDKNHRASFAIFNVISERGKACRTSGKFALHYYIVKKSDSSKKIFLYVATMMGNYCEETEEGASTTIIEGIELKDILFLEEGKYVLEGYFSEEITDGEFEDFKEKKEEIMKEENLITKYDFEVKF